MLQTPLIAVTHVYLSFAYPNFEIDDSRNKLKRFIKSLTALKKIQFGPIQMKQGLESRILSMVPEKVNCHFEGIFMFQRVPKSLVMNNISFSDVSFELTRVVRETPLMLANQFYHFKNYQPENIDFEKSMIYQNLPFMTMLHINQNPNIIKEENLKLFIQDKEMQLIFSRGINLVSLSLRCNLKLLTDCGLTGLKQEICKNILDQYKINNEVGLQTLNAQQSLPTSKAGLGLSLSNLPMLQNFVLYDAGENVTDATAFIAFRGMQQPLKTIIVTSPKLTEIGIEGIGNSFPGINLAIEWHA